MQMFDLEGGQWCTVSPTLATPLSCFSGRDKPSSDCRRLRFSSRGESKELEPGVVESEHGKVGGCRHHFLPDCGLSVLEFLSVISSDSTNASGRRYCSVLLFCCCFKYFFQLRFENSSVSSTLQVGLIIVFLLYHWNPGCQGSTVNFAAIMSLFVEKNIVP